MGEQFFNPIVSKSTILYILLTRTNDKTYFNLGLVPLLLYLYSYLSVY